MKRKDIYLVDGRDDWAPWTAARFADGDSRDRFLRAIATREAMTVQAESVPDDALTALVRWRPGQFLKLNDTAYAHGGRIVPAIPRYWG